jgi:hypothetical protein
MAKAEPAPATTIARAWLRPSLPILLLAVLAAESLGYGGCGRNMTATYKNNAAKFNELEEDWRISNPLVGPQWTGLGPKGSHPRVVPARLSSPAPLNHPRA